MKNKSIGAILLIGFGFGIGWLAKPASSSSSTPPIAATGRVPNAVASARSTALDQPPVPTSRKERSLPEKGIMNGPLEIRQGLTPEMAVMMSKKEIQDKKVLIQQRIVQLDEKLHLIPAQKSRLTTWLESNIKKMEAMEMSDLKSFQSISDVARSLSNETLENELASDLTADQQTALTEINQKDFARKVDTIALKTLSKIQEDIDFEEGQRDEIYKILTQNAEKSVREKLKTPESSGMFEDNGLSADPYDLQLQDTMGSNGIKLSDLGGSGEHKITIDQAMMEKMNKRVNEKVDQLRPFLNEKQLAIYREKLDANKYASLIGGGGGGPHFKVFKAN